MRRRRATDPLPPIPGPNPSATRPRNDTLPPIPDARPPRARSEVLQPVSEVKPKVVIKKTVIKPPAQTPTDTYTSNNKEVQFLIQVKDQKKPKKPDDAQSNTTDTTETILVGRRDNDLKEENEMLRRELDASKARCERAERDKSDILLRRLASMDTSTNRTAAAEALKLQQQVNEMKQQVEELQDDKKSLTSKVKELSSEINGRPSKTMEEMLRNKLEQAERMCEALMDENEDMKREVKNMESEIDEMQDNFREEQADEYVSVKKELEQTTKNCRILSFKLKKSDRKIEMLEGDKQDVGTQSNIELVTKIKKLEDDLKIANEVARRLQAETETEPKKKAPALGKIGKSTSDGGKISRASLTRGGSQEDPVQLLRDLQDSMEREADLREQLKFAEEEVSNIDDYKTHSLFSYQTHNQLLQNYYKTKRLTLSNIELTDIRPRQKVVYNAGTQTYDDRLAIKFYYIDSNLKHDKMNDAIKSSSYSKEMVIYAPIINSYYSNQNFYLQFLVSNVFLRITSG